MNFIIDHVYIFFENLFENFYLFLSFLSPINTKFKNVINIIILRVFYITIIPHIGQCQHGLLNHSIDLLENLRSFLPTWPAIIDKENTLFQIT